MVFFRGAVHSSVHQSGLRSRLFLQFGAESRTCTSSGGCVRAPLQFCGHLRCRCAPASQDTELRAAQPHPQLGVLFSTQVCRWGPWPALP